MTDDLLTLVEVCANDFTFVIAVCTAQAPISSAYFLTDVDAGTLDGSSIFRIVNLHNQPADHPSKIEVIQMGWRETDPAILPSIRHETTGMTGLRHRKGTVSLARFAPGAAYHSWFVCMRDEPGLDQGGGRVIPTVRDLRHLDSSPRGWNISRAFSMKMRLRQNTLSTRSSCARCGVCDAKGDCRPQWSTQSALAITD